MAQFTVAAREIGFDVKPLPKMMMDTVKEAGGHGGVRVKAEYQVSHETLGGGQSPERVAARIRRDRPDIAERVMAGDFPSMRAAGVEAGIVKPKVSVFATVVMEHLDQVTPTSFGMLSSTITLFLFR